MRLGGDYVQVQTEHQHKGEGGEEGKKEDQWVEVADELHLRPVEAKHDEHMWDEQPDGDAQTEVVPIRLDVELVLLQGEVLSVVPYGNVQRKKEEKTTDPAASVGEHWTGQCGHFSVGDVHQRQKVGQVVAFADGAAAVRLAAVEGATIGREVCRGKAPKCAARGVSKFKAF